LRETSPAGSSNNTHPIHHDPLPSAGALTLQLLPLRLWSAAESGGAPDASGLPLSDPEPASMTVVTALVPAPPAPADPASVASTATSHTSVSAPTSGEIIAQGA
jgi:hypothetical protein